MSASVHVPFETDRVPASARLIVELRQQIAILRRQRDQARSELALHRIDPTTGLPTRRHWTRLATGMAGGAVMLADLDGFKAVNDRWGHPAGDAVLAAVARRLLAGLPRDSLVGRLGGDEFAALSTRPLSPGELDRLVASVTEPIPHAEARLQIGISLGIAANPPSLSAGLAAADRAMYAAKRAGGGWRAYDAREHGIPEVADRPTRRGRHTDPAEGDSR